MELFSAAVLFNQAIDLIYEDSSDDEIEDEIKTLVRLNTPSRRNSDTLLR